MHAGNPKTATRFSVLNKPPYIPVRACGGLPSLENLDLQVTLAHDAAVIHGPAWAAVSSDLGRQEMARHLE